MQQWFFWGYVEAQLLVSTKVRIPLTQFVEDDVWVCALSSLSSITLKSSYWLSRSASWLPNQYQLKGQIWKTKIHERYETHLWRIATNCLLTRGKISRCLDLPNRSCPICFRELETVVHLFTSCHLSRALCHKCKLRIRIDEFNFQSNDQFIGFLLKPL